MRGELCKTHCRSKYKWTLCEYFLQALSPAPARFHFHMLVYVSVLSSGSESEKNSLEKYSTQAKQKKVHNKIMYTAYTAGSIMCNRRFSIITGNQGKETFQIWKENLVLVPSLSLCFVFFRLDLVFLLQFYRLRYHLTRRFILFVTLLLSLTCLLLLLTCFMLFPDLLVFLLFLFRSFRSGFIAIL